MEWTQLISNKRFGQEHKHAERHDDRSEFKRDYDRLIFSSAFRRLQNKTQVFPLPGSIFVHNRLTHSLEVASVGMSLGNDISRHIIQKRPELKDTLFEEIGTIVSAACLAHDLGNPPFGHSGEKAIQTFFSEGAGQGLKDEVSAEFWDDITHFEGNANGFRILTHRFKGRRRTLILSDIQQSGMNPADLYREVSRLAKERGVEKFIGIGPVVSDNANRIDIKDSFFFSSVSSFLDSTVFRTLRDEVILIKGARQFGFDQITDLLVEKVHETVLEVNLNAVVANLNYYRSFMKPETKLVCMIKADAYGAGSVEIAKTLQDHRVDYLAVAVADEGATLRRNGITSNIMIMNPEMSAFKTMFDYDLEPEVYSFRLLDALVKAAEKEGITGWPVHIKLDTGMHRLGFDPEKDIDKLIDRLKHQDAIIPRSVFSHFVGSDSDDFDAFSAHQFELFDKGSRKLQAAFSHKILRHIDNSAGIEHFPERQLDMCRLGLGLYGINSRNNHVINNVSTLKTTILQLRNVPAGDTVGYSRKGTIDHDSVIAAIPIGYADGLNRHLGNRHCYCLVNGHKAEYVGNICMDVAMIDVTGIPCKEGDSVEIFGDDLPVTVLSDVLDTIPYEVLTGISNRVKRVYFQD